MARGPVKRRLSAPEFDALKPFVRMTDERLSSARLVLVDNKTYEEVSNQYGCSRQTIGSAINTLWRAHMRTQESHKIVSETELHDGWEQVTLAAPSYLIPMFREVIDEANTLPEGWEQIILAAPSKLIRKFIREAQEAKAKHRLKEDNF